MLISSLAAYCKFFLKLPKFLSKTVTFEEAKSAIAERMRNRSKNFLEILRKGVFGSPKSPYLKLFKAANYSYKDIEDFVKKLGLEATLELLRDRGVYFSIEEFKGRIPVKRRGMTFWVSPKDFDSALLVRNSQRNDSIDNESNVPSISSLGLENAKELLFRDIIFMYAHGMLDLGVSPVFLLTAFPSIPGIGAFLSLAKAGNPPVKWFAIGKSGRGRVSLFEYLGLQFILALSRCCCHRSAELEIVSEEECERKLFDFIIKNNKKRLFVVTRWTSIIHLCDMAHAQHRRFDNVVFLFGGRPITDQIIEKVYSLGARLILSYGFREMTHVAYSCPGKDCNMNDIDDYHLCVDTLAMILREREVAPGENIKALLWTGLSLNLPKILINVESGDCAEVVQRNCDCAFGQLSFSTHLSKIKSFEKFVSARGDFFLMPLANLVENDLPRQFGGNIFDYQFVEERITESASHISLYICPSLGSIDEASVNALIYNKLTTVFNAQRIIPSIWPEDGAIRIIRKPPIPTVRGRVHPFYVIKD